MQENQDNGSVDVKSPIGGLLGAVIRQELKNTHKLLVSLIIVCAALLASLAANAWLIYERLQYDVVYEYVDETQTDGYKIDVDGDGNNFVGGNQYNDNATHNEGAAE